MTWFSRFNESLKHHVGKRIANIVSRGWDELPTGRGKRSLEERERWIKSALDRLDDLCDRETGNRVMIDTCPHSYPKTRIRKMRAELERLGNLDDLLELMRQDTSWGGGSFYDYPVREDNIIYVTKVPFNPKAHHSAETDDERRLAYCHCSLVKRSKEKISSTFCCCSGGWVKQLWEGIFEEPVDVWLTESLLKDDAQCTHAVQIPPRFL